VFTEKETHTELVENNNLSEKIAIMVNEYQSVDKVVLVGAKSYTENIKNRVSSLLETQYE